MAVFITLAGCPRERDGHGVAVSDGGQSTTAAVSAATAPAASAPSSTCTAPDVALYAMDRDNHAICARPCKKDAECPAAQACVGTASKVPGTGTAHDVVDICAAAKAPAAAPSTGVPICKAPDVLLYTTDRENKAFCGRPCKKDAECAAGQACAGTGSKVQGTGTAHDVIEICAASKAPARAR